MSAVLLLVLLAALFTINKENTKVMDVELSDPNKSVYELTSTCYSQKILIDIADARLDYDVLNAKYPVECIRAYGENYRVTYT